MRLKQKKTALDALNILGVLFTTTTTIADHNLPLRMYGDESVPRTLKVINFANCQAQSEIKVKEIPCQSSSDENHLFESPPILDFSSQIDLRPENCQSYFDDYLHTRRGLRIEAALEDTPPFTEYKKTVANFPVIDFIDGRTAHIVKSKDLSSNTYISDSINSLYENIIQDAEELKTRLTDKWDKGETISAKMHDITTQIGSNEVHELTLHIVIQSGIASPQQVTQIHLARIELMKRWGIELKVIEIP